MQKVQYFCDQCNKMIGDKKHLSLSFSNHSGVAIPPGQATKANGYYNGEYWTIDNKLQSKFIHFCSGRCAGQWFTNLLKK